MQARSIEAGEPHVPNEHDPEGVVGIAEPHCQCLAALLVADVRLPVGRIGFTAGHDDLDPAVGVVPLMPLGTQASQFPVEVDADAAAHADDHRLAVDSFEPPVEV